jgi:hypothetical protein
MNTVLFILLIVALFWFFWPMPREGFTHKGMAYGVPVYLDAWSDELVPVIAGRTKGFDFIISCGWMEFCQFVDHVLTGSEGFRVEFTGEIKPARSKPRSSDEVRHR